MQGTCHFFQKLLASETDVAKKTSLEEKIELMLKKCVDFAVEKKDDDKKNC